MKNHFTLSLLLAILVFVPIYADEAPGLTCETAPYVGAEYTAHLTPGTYWFYSTSYDFPFSIEYVWDRSKMSYSKSSPEFIVDFSCEAGVYEDPTLYEVIKFAKDSLDKEIPTIGHLSPNANNNWYRTFDGDYRVSLYMFGITNNIKIYIKMTVQEEGDVYFNSTSQHALCANQGIDMEMGMTIDLSPEDSVDMYKWPLAEWVQYNYEMVWTGEDELYVAQGNKCNVTRTNDATMDNEHYFIEEYDGVYTWLSNRSLKEAKDYKITDEFVRFYPEGKGQFSIRRLPTRINTFALKDSTVFATIDQDNRIIKAVLPKGSVPELIVPDAKIIFEPADQVYSFNNDYTEITIDDGMNSKYTLDISVVPNSANTDATLSSILVDNEPIAGFSPSKYEYTVDCKAVPVVSAVTNDPNASYTVKQATDWNRTAIVTVAAEDIYETQDYLVNITLPAHTDATLRDLRANDITIKGFSRDVFRYEYNVTKPENIPLIVGTANDYRAQSCEVTKEASKTVLPDSTEVTCVAEDGSKQVYTVVFDKFMGSDATLASLRVNGEEFVNPEATVNVTVGSLPPAIVATPTDPKATYYIDEPKQVLAFTQYPVVVTAEDGETTQTYRVWCTVDATADASLKAINVNGDLIEGFAANTLDYQLQLNDKPVITWETNDPNAKAELSEKTVSDITNYLITVTAANGTTQQIYSVTVNVKKLGTDATLSFISIDGGENAIEGFDAGKFSYNFDVDAVPADALIEAETNDPKATLVKEWIDDSTVKFTVTAEDGVTTNTYTINFHVNIIIELNHDATLAWIAVKDVMSVDHPEAGVPVEFNVTSNDFKVEWAATEPTTDVVEVWTDDTHLELVTLAEDQITSLTYYVTVNVQVAPPLSDDATLKSITVDGQTITSFVEGGQPNQFTVTTLDDFAYQTNDPNATAELSWAGNNLTIEITAENGVTKARYFFVFTVYSPSSDATLQSITVDGQTITSFVEGGQPNLFTVNTLEDFAYQINDPKATAVLTWNETILTIDITAEDGITKARYFFIFTVYTPSHDATLAYVRLFDEILNDFVPNIPNTVTLNAIPTEDDVEIVTTDTKATISYVWSDNTLTIDITAEDGYTTLRYVFVVDVHIPSADNTLSDLMLDGLTIEDFSPLTSIYNVTVQQLPVVSAQLSDAAATFVVNQPTEENPVATVVVTAENGKVRTYTVNFTIYVAPVVSLIPLEVEFVNGFKGFIDADKKTIAVYYLSTESVPAAIKSWKPQEGYTVYSVDMVSYNSLKVTSPDGEAVYAISYYPVSYANLHSGITYYFDGTEDYIKTAYYYTDSRGWRLSKDVEEEENRRISRGKDRLYFFIPGCAAIRLNTTTASRSIRISLNGEDITEKQVQYNSLSEAYYTASQGEITYINGLTKRKPMMLEIESEGSTGDAAFNAITLLAEETGWEDNTMSSISFINGVILNPEGLELKVYGITGQLVAESSTNIDLNGQPAAVYIIRCNEQAIKIVK